MCLVCTSRGEGEGSRKCEKAFIQSQQFSLWTCWGVRRKAWGEADSGQGAQWATIAMAAAAVAAAAVFFINVLFAHQMPDNNNNNDTDNGTKERRRRRCHLLNVPCPFASWLFAYFYHRFDAVAATEIIDKVFNQPLTHTQTDTHRDSRERGKCVWVTLLPFTWHYNH